MKHQDWETIVIKKPNKETIKHKPINDMGAKHSKLDADGDMPIEAKKKPLLGKQITQMRLIKELNQKQFAQILNIQESTLRNYEADKEQPPGPIKTKIQKITGINFN